jgi:hypothetical protein
VQWLDHVGVVVDDLHLVTAFFEDFGIRARGSDAT